MIMIERTTGTVLMEKIMLGDEVDNFPNLFIYFYLKVYNSRDLDIYIWNKNSNINENDISIDNKYIIVVQYDGKLLNYTQILNKKGVNRYIRFIVKGIMKKHVTWYGVYNIELAERTNSLLEKYSDKVNVSVKEINNMNK